MANGSEFAEQRRRRERSGNLPLTPRVAGTGEAIGEEFSRQGWCFNRLGRFMPNGTVKRLVDSQG